MEPIKPLSRQEMINVIEGKSCASRIPVTYQFWGGRHSSIGYPYDMATFNLPMPSHDKAPENDPNYKWVNIETKTMTEGVGIDAKGCLDWNNLDDVLKHFPSVESPALFGKGGPPAQKPHDDGRYRLGWWWSFLFERHWLFRGMERALLDFYDNPDEVHRLYRAVTDFYKKAFLTGHEKIGLNGLMISDDLGTQTGPFFSLEIFNEFYKPYYKEVVDTVHSVGGHFWLHCCGNIELLLPEFIEIGIDVIHPIQKYTMDEALIAKKFGDKICIWCGFDVQQNIPFGTPDDCRKEVRHLIDTYARTDGRFILTFGNGRTNDWPPASVDAVFEETFEYGTKKISELKKLS